ncbi:protein cornichon homolog 4 [Caerostris extrusa]|uniref:Protein cornichon homolog 4 n=1 Tax=Caerostris extrusa TaxID=172846 RepID=A0AAV4VET1_CAEEX|nr:protein cornichon homolog 4 [Caerostris extrusa]
MIGDVSLFVFSLFDIGALLFLTVFVVITLSDLECDYLNAQQCCSKLNKWIIPEIIAQGFVTILMLIEWHWFFVSD